MLLSMTEVEVLMQFFRDYVAKEEKGVRVLLKRIDDYNEANSSEEGEQQRQVINAVPNENLEPNPNSIEVDDVNYMLFLKAPQVTDDKQAKKDKDKFMTQCTPEDKQMREHIQKLLHEAESLEQLKATLMDPNSLSEIMSVIRQHTEKKKAFG